MDRDSTITKPGAFYVGNGWVAGGTGWFCWWLASGSFPHSLSTSKCFLPFKNWMFLLLWSWHLYIYLVGGWPTPLKKYEFVSWDNYSQYMENKKIFQTTNQYIYIYIINLGSRHGNVWNECFITTSAGYYQWYWSWKTALWGSMLLQSSKGYCSTIFAINTSNLRSA